MSTYQNLCSLFTYVNHMFTYAYHDLNRNYVVRMDGMVCWQAHQLHDERAPGYNQLPKLTPQTSPPSPARGQA